MLAGGIAGEGLVRIVEIHLHPMCLEQALESRPVNLFGLDGLPSTFATLGSACLEGHSHRMLGAMTRTRTFSVLESSGFSHGLFRQCVVCRKKLNGNVDASFLQAIQFAKYVGKSRHLLFWAGLIVFDARPGADTMLALGGNCP